MLTKKPTPKPVFSRMHINSLGGRSETFESASKQVQGFGRGRGAKFRLSHLLYHWLLTLCIALPRIRMMHIKEHKSKATNSRWRGNTSDPTSSHHLGPVSHDQSVLIQCQSSVKQDSLSCNHQDMISAPSSSEHSPPQQHPLSAHDRCRAGNFQQPPITTNIY